jgi:hypothetical protein
MTPSHNSALRSLKYTLTRKNYPQKMIAEKLEWIQHCSVREIKGHERLILKAPDYSKGRDIILPNLEYSENLPSEIQHAVQDNERFNLGINPNS